MPSPLCGRAPLLFLPSSLLNWLHGWAASASSFPAWISLGCLWVVWEADLPGSSPWEADDVAFRPSHHCSLELIGTLLLILALAYDGRHVLLQVIGLDSSKPLLGPLKQGAILWQRIPQIQYAPTKKAPHFAHPKFPSNQFHWIIPDFSSEREGKKLLSVHSLHPNRPRHTPLVVCLFKAIF